LVAGLLPNPLRELTVGGEGRKKDRKGWE